MFKLKIVIDYFYIIWILIFYRKRVMNEKKEDDI